CSSRRQTSRTFTTVQLASTLLRYIAVYIPIETPIWRRAELRRCPRGHYPLVRPGAERAPASAREAAVRIGLVSDIHCNTEGLTAALEQLGELDLLLCAGDIVLQYRFSDDVIALLRAREALAIQGNHDKIIVSPHGENVRRAGQGAPEHWEWLVGLPHQRRLDLDGWRLLLAHGAPWDDPRSLHCEYVYPADTGRLSQMARCEAEIVVLGHTHFPM